MTRSNDISCTKENLRRKYGHLVLENRLCVAMSRQKRLLIVAGDSAMLNGEIAAEHLHGLVKFKEMCQGEHGCEIR
jgi:superfamily I DNA and/or RNA helicase